ncbi:MAG TPA: biopolymer transporter ExbD [Kiritimatiellia bacterium]
MRPVRGLLDVAPWVNIALLMLMFFTAQSSFVLRPGIAVDLPAAPMTDGAGYRSQVVTLGRNNMVFFNDERTTLDGLAPRLADAARRDPDATLVVEADERVEHVSLIRLYNMAQAAGFPRVVLATRLPDRPVESP